MLKAIHAGEDLVPGRAASDRKAVRPSTCYGGRSLENQRDVFLLAYPIENRSAPTHAPERILREIGDGRASFAHSRTGIQSTAAHSAGDQRQRPSLSGTSTASPAGPPRHNARRSVAQMTTGSFLLVDDIMHATSRIGGRS
jgi:hypothetical protein